MKLTIFNVYFYFFIMIMVCGLMMWNKYESDHLEPFTTVAVITDEADLPEVKGKTTAPIDVMKISQPTSEMIAKGKELFAQNCASCHGSDGKGDGPGAAALKVKPRNFLALDGWKNGSKLSQMFKTVTVGIVETGMPGFDFISASDRFNMIHYIRTLNPGYPKDDRADLIAMDRQFSLSRGAKEPSQIPVAKAIEKLVQESSDRDRKIQTILEAEQNTDDSPLSDVSFDRNKAITTLVHSSAWVSSASELMKLAMSNPPQNGFSPKVFNLSQNQWEALYRYVRKYFVKG